MSTAPASSAPAWMSALEEAKVATTEEERERIFRFRYRIYVEELGYRSGQIDHQQKRLVDPEDFAPYSQLLYTGQEEVTATGRISVWQPGQVPPVYFQDFSMALFPRIGQCVVAEAGRMMIDPTKRGSMLLPSIVSGLFRAGVEGGADFIFASCMSGLVKHYKKMGLRPYAGAMVPTAEGVSVPLVMICSDLLYFREVGSFLAPVAARYFDEGDEPHKRAPLNAAIYESLFDSADLPVQTDPDAVWEETQSQLFQMAQDDEETFLERLPTGLVRKLADRGFLMSLAPGQVLTEKGMTQREMFILLEGVVAVEQDGRRLCTLDQGELIGEVAFFRDSGTRSATVRAMTDCKVLVLRRRFLRELLATDPREAASVALELANVLAERLAAKTT